MCLGTFHDSVLIRKKKILHRISRSADFILHPSVQTTQSSCINVTYVLSVLQRFLYCASWYVHRMNESYQPNRQHQQYSLQELRIHQFWRCEAYLLSACVVRRFAGAKLCRKRTEPSVSHTTRLISTHNKRRANHFYPIKHKCLFLILTTAQFMLLIIIEFPAVILKHLLT